MAHLSQRSVIFLTPSIDTPSTRYRVICNFPLLERQGWHPTLEQIPKGPVSRIRLFNSLSGYDIVVLQKKLFQWWALRYIRLKSNRLIYDFDDAVLFRDSNAGDFHSASRSRRFNNTLRQADVVMAGNAYLRSLAEPVNRNIFIVPTGIDTALFSPEPRIRHRATPVIGWIGSKPNLIYLKKLIAPINRLWEIHPTFRLKIVCDDFIDGFACPVEKKRWHAQEAVKDIRDFDIGVMPLAEDLWTRGKCAFKLLQYMSCGIASVASTTRVTAGIIEDGKNGFLAVNSDQWVEKLSWLLKHPERRTRMGQEARFSLEGRFDTETIGRAVADIFAHSTGENPVSVVNATGDRLP